MTTTTLRGMDKYLQPPLQCWTRYEFTTNRVVMMPTYSSVVAHEVVLMTTYCATSDGKVGIMVTFVTSLSLWMPWHCMVLGHQQC